MDTSPNSARMVLAGAIALCTLATGCTSGSEPLTRQESLRDEERQSSPSPRAKVPNVSYMKLRSAKKLLQERSFETGEITLDGTGVRDVVLKQNPRAGLELDAGTAVDLVVSKLYPIPLLIVPSLGAFGWTCRGRTYRIGFKLDETGATTEVRYLLPDGTEKRKTVHGGSVSAPVQRTGRQTWELVQRTKPQTIKARVAIELATRCSTYLAPTTRLTLKSRSH